MTKLKEYLARERINQREFAERIEVDPSIVSRLSRDKMSPSLPLAAKIERETNGFIPAVSWVEADSAVAE